MTDQYDMDTREGRLANNREIMVGEKSSDDEVFYNEIETRLGLPIELRNEADERLGDAYVNSLAQYEAEGEYATWAPLSVRHLVDHEGVTIEEAGVIVTMAAREYPVKDHATATCKPKSTKDELRSFVRWLREDTDVFTEVEYEMWNDEFIELNLSAYLDNPEDHMKVVEAFMKKAN